MPIDPHYAISGFLVGARVGVTGVGGGSLMTPILIVLFGVSPATGVVEFASNDTGVPKLFTHSVEPFRFEGRARSPLNMNDQNRRAERARRSLQL